MRAKRHKNKRKQLRRQNAFEVTDLENRLYELQERAEEVGLDALMAEYDPSALTNKRKDTMAGNLFDDK